MRLHALLLLAAAAAAAVRAATVPEPLIRLSFEGGDVSNVATHPEAPVVQELGSGIEYSVGEGPVSGADAIATPGENGCVTIGTTGVGLGSTEGYTISVWFKNAPAGTSTLARGYGPAGGNHPALWINGVLGAYDNNPNRNVPSSYTSADLGTGGWHHFAAVGTGSDETVFYIDGEQVATVAFASRTNLYALLGYQGDSQVSPVQGFKSPSFDLRVWLEPLDADQVRAVMASVKAPPRPRALMAFSGTSAVDVSGNGATTDSAGTRPTVASMAGPGSAGTVSASVQPSLSHNWIFSPPLPISSPGSYTFMTWSKAPFVNSAGASWVTLARGGEDHFLLNPTTGQAQGTSLGYYDNGDVTFYQASPAFSVYSLEDGWHHIAVVGDASGTHVYVNGDLTGTHAKRSEYDDVQGFLGYQGGNQGWANAGNYDFRFYDESLSQADIRTAMRSGAHPKDEPEAAPAPGSAALTVGAAHGKNDPVRFTIEIRDTWGLVNNNIGTGTFTITSRDEFSALSSGEASQRRAPRAQAVGAVTVDSVPAGDAFQEAEVVVEVAAPAGGWTDADNGEYVLYAVAGGLRSVTGAAVETPTELATLDVDVSCSAESLADEFVAMVPGPDALPDTGIDGRDLVVSFVVPHRFDTAKLRFAGAGALPACQLESDLRDGGVVVDNTETWSAAADTACSTKYTFRRELAPALKDCAFDGPFDGDGEFYYEAVLEAETVAPVDGVFGSTVDRTEVSAMRVRVTVPESVSVTSGDVQAFPGFAGLEVDGRSFAVVSTQAYNVDTETFTLRVITAVAWPYVLELDGATPVERSSGSNTWTLGASDKGGDCDSGAAVDNVCVQQWDLTLARLSDCEVDGEYDLNFDVRCSDAFGNGDGCETHENPTASITIPVESDSVCARVVEVATVTPTIVTSTTQGGSQATDFVLQTTLFGRVSVAVEGGLATSEVELTALDIQSDCTGCADSLVQPLADSSPAPADAYSWATTPGTTFADFEFQLNAASVPFDTGAGQASITLTATVAVTYVTADLQKVTETRRVQMQAGDSETAVVSASSQFTLSPGSATNAGAGGSSSTAGSTVLGVSTGTAMVAGVGLVAVVAVALFAGVATRRRGARRAAAAAAAAKRSSSTASLAAVQLDVAPAPSAVPTDDLRTVQSVYAGQ